jgi:hypothetical protein
MEREDFKMMMDAMGIVKPKTGIFDGDERTIVNINKSDTKTMSREEKMQIVIGLVDRLGLRDYYSDLRDDDDPDCSECDARRVMNEALEEESYVKMYEDVKKEYKDKFKSDEFCARWDKFWEEYNPRGRYSYKSFTRYCKARDRGENMEEYCKRRGTMTVEFMEMHPWTKDPQ